MRKYNVTVKRSGVDFQDNVTSSYPEETFLVEAPDHYTEEMLEKIIIDQINDPDVKITKEL